MDIEHGQHNVSLMLFYTTYRNTLCRYNINYMYTMSLYEITYKNQYQLPNPIPSHSLKLVLKYMH